MAAAQVPSLLAILAEMPDPRQPRGRRHRLDAMLTVLCLAVLCGSRSVLAVSEWGPQHDDDLRERLGFGGRGYPSPATWYRVLRRIDVAAFESRVGAWVEQVLGVLGAPGERLAVAIDGKTLRTSRQMGAADSVLLSAATHPLGLVVAQVAVRDGTNEPAALTALLAELVLEGRVVTADAGLANHELAGRVVAAGGDYVFPIKHNQDRTWRAIDLWFAGPAPVGFPSNQVVEQTEKSHGRLIHRRIETTTVLNDYLDWPALGQAFRLTRDHIDPDTGEIHTDVAFGITSLSPPQATPADLLSFVRQHWTIENRVHWVRDVTFDEDRSTLRAGHTHHVMATVRNLVIALLRIHGWS